VAGAAAAALAATALAFRGDPLSDRAQTHAQQLYQCAALFPCTFSWQYFFDLHVCCMLMAAATCTNA
jgi:hypothetical protein